MKEKNEFVIENGIAPPKQSARGAIKAIPHKSWKIVQPYIRSHWDAWQRGGETYDDPENFAVVMENEYDGKVTRETILKWERQWRGLCRF